MKTAKDNNMFLEYLGHVLTAYIGLSITLLVSGLIVMLNSDASYPESLSASFHQYKYTGIFMFAVLLALSPKIDLFLDRHKETT